MARLFRRQDDVPKRSFWDRFKDFARTDIDVFIKGVDEGSLEALEALLLEADFGVPTTLALVAEVERRARLKEIRSAKEFHLALARGIENTLRSGNSDPAAVGQAVLTILTFPTIAFGTTVNTRNLRRFNSLFSACREVKW